MVGAAGHRSNRNDVCPIILAEDGNGFWHINMVSGCIFLRAPRFVLPSEGWQERLGANWKREIDGCLKAVR